MTIHSIGHCRPPTFLPQRPPHLPFLDRRKVRRGGGGQRVRCGSSTLALSRRLVHPRLRLLEKDVIVLDEKDVNFEEERQSGSSSGWVSPLHVQRTACSYEFSCMEIVWPSV